MPFLIHGFVFAMPGSKARTNPTARLHAFAEIRHMREIAKNSIENVKNEVKPLEH